MTHTFKLTPRAAGFRVPVLTLLLALAFAGCDVTDSTDPFTSDIDVTDAELVPTEPTLAAGRFAGGIPFGTSNQPSEQFGAQYNGALRNIYPQFLLTHLAQIKARGGKVVLTFSGSPKTFTDAKGHFSLSKWKARVDRFKNVNITSYINDGTIVAHYLMDEPHNSHRWKGKPVSPATIDEMARYSKARWPGMATVVRAYPDWLAKYSGKYRYLDAGWLQYVHRFGDVDNFTRKQISYAQQKGLALIVGLNVIKGGPNNRKMTASQVKSYGSALLASSYPCAFISWKHDARYLSSKDIKDAMKVLRSKAQNRGVRSCRGGAKQSAPPASSPGGTPSAGPPSGNAPSSIVAKVVGQVEKKRHHLTLTWSGIKGDVVDIHRNYRSRVIRSRNSGRFQNFVPFRGPATYVFKVCQKGTSKCSKTVRRTFR